MAIPKLEVPTYELTIPSTGKKAKYRPFLVKEYKALLMARESDDSDISRVMEEIVDICTFNKLNLKTLASFDIEYIFLKMRAKSVGEKIDLVLTCRSCENKIDFSVNIDNVELQKDKDHISKFMLTESVGVEMKYPRFKLDLPDLIQTGIDNYFEEIERCIKGIYTSDGKYFDITVDDKEELKEFVASMNIEQFGKIEKFFQTMPKLSKSVELVCTNCNAINKAKVEGLANFFV